MKTELFYKFVAVTLLIVFGVTVVKFANYNRQTLAEKEIVIINEKSSMSVIEIGTFQNSRYYVWEDKATKTRVFYFCGNMVVLPSTNFVK